MFAEKVYRRLVVIALVLTVALAACAGPKTNGSGGGSTPSSFGADLAAFQQNPTETSWEALHTDLLAGSLSQNDESKIVRVLAETDVPRRVFNETAIDLAANDFPGVIKWVHEIHMGYRTDNSPEAKLGVKRTALLAWVLLALRASFDNNFVDLGSMDLRTNEPFIGQSMNLTNVNFQGGLLPGGTWRRSNLANARFDQAVPDGRLRCIRCAWGSLRYDGTVELVQGEWIPT